MYFYENEENETFEKYVCETGPRHPEEVCVSSNLTFSQSITLQLDDVHRKLLPYLSGLQIQAVALICQKHKEFLPNGHRAGFLLGDGTGMGKTRVIAASILQNVYDGRGKHLFITASSNLFENLNIECQKLNAPNNFRTITLKEREKFKTGILFLTYMDLRDNYNFIIELMNPNFDGIIAYDECHMAKSFSKNGVIGKCVVRLQENLPKSRVIYASATALSSPENIEYLTRLGLWGERTSFVDSKSFVDNLKKRGISGMELVACDLMKKKAFLSRQLSQDGVVNVVSICKTNKNSEMIYQASVEMWKIIIKYAKKHGNSRIMSVIWRAHQIYFTVLCVSIKVQKCIEETRKALKGGKQVIIGIQTTGESLYKQRVNCLYEKPYSLLRSLLKNVLQKHLLIEVEDFSAEPKAKKAKLDQISNQDKDDDVCDERSENVDESSKDDDDSSENGDQSSEDDQSSETSTISGEENEENLKREQNSLKKSFHLLEPYLPRNTLDLLISELGGENKVAELTGRLTKEKQVLDGSRKISYTAVKRNSLAENDQERGLFQQSIKKIAIISNVASVGISLHADKQLKLKDVEKVPTRYHITLEFPWSADRLVQQLGSNSRHQKIFPNSIGFCKENGKFPCLLIFGRSHRSNQVSPPEYLFLITNIPGELRVVGTLATRVAHLGALTQGDRRSTVPILDDYINDTNEILGVAILKHLLESVSQDENKLLNKLLKIGVFKIDNDDIKLASCSRNSRGFFNRLLGLKIKDQKKIYEKFLDSKELVMNQIPADTDINLFGQNFNFVSTETTSLSDRFIHHEIIVDPRMSLGETVNLRNSSHDYHFLKNKTNGKVFLAINEKDLLRLYTPEIGKRELINLFIMNWAYKEISLTYFQNLWKRQYDENVHDMKIFNIISGDVLGVWTNLEKQLNLKRIQLVRVRLTKDNGIYGLLVPNNLINKAKLAVI